MSRLYSAMRWRRALQAVLTGIAVLYSPFVFAFPQKEPQVVIDEQSVDEATAHLRTSLAGWVEAIRRQTPGSLHLVFAFSTGHFDNDPLAGDAARRISAKFGGTVLKEGDEFSVYGWEMDVWFSRKRLAPGGASLKIEQQILDDCPVTPRQGSIDGHDTERAVVEIVGELGEPSNQLVLLITNHAQSVAPPKRPNYLLLGENSPEYRNALESWERLPRIKESGASFELSYKVVRMEGGVMERFLDVVVVVPRGLQPVSPPSQGPRKTKEVPSEEPSQAPSRLGVVVLLAAIVVFGVVIWRWIQSSFGGTPFVEIEGERVTLAGTKPGSPVCVLVGEGWEPDSSPQEVRKVVLRGAPPKVPLVTLFRAKNPKEGLVRLQGNRARVEKVNDKLIPGDEVPLRDGEHQVELKIRQEGVGGIPEETRITVIVVVRRETR